MARAATSPRSTVAPATRTEIDPGDRAALDHRDRRVEHAGRPTRGTAAARGRRPRSARPPTPPAPRPTGRWPRGCRGSRRGRGSGRRAGPGVGWPSRAASRSTNRSETACSSTSASSWTSSQPYPSISTRNVSIEPVPAHHRERVPLAVGRELDGTVGLVGDQAAVGEPADGLRDGGRPDAEAGGQHLGGDGLLRPLARRPHDLEVVLRDGAQLGCRSECSRRPA